jgi:DNA-binding IclR family transcriptional regulator
MAELPAQPNQSLIDGLAVLRALAVAGEPVGSREMARRLALEPTRVNRLLKTLASIGVARQTADRRYVPGPAMHVLSVQAVYGSGLLRRAARAVERLRPLKLHVAVGVLWQRHVVYLYQWRPGRSSDDALAVSGLYPAEHSGVGVPLLAAMSDAEVRSLYKEQPPQGGMADLLARLRDARAARHAYLPRDAHRVDDGLGVAIGANAAFAAITLAGAIAPADVPKLIEPLHQAAADIAAEE